MDVAIWLRGLELEQYEATFRDNDVNAEILPDSDGDDLKETRRHLRSAIAADSWRRLLRCASRQSG